jgi:hypothetical protein
MPLTEKGSEIMGAMKEQYGAEKGEKVFYASRNKGTIKGVDAKEDDGVVMTSPAKADKGPGHLAPHTGKDSLHHAPNGLTPLARAEAAYDDERLLEAVAKHCDSIEARLDACKDPMVRAGENG